MRCPSPEEVIGICDLSPACHYMPVTRYRFYAHNQRKGDSSVSMHPIADKDEVAIDFPEKFYSGGFGRDSSFEAHAEDEGVLIRLVRPGPEKRAASIHLHHFLLASILTDLAQSIADRNPIDIVHREPLLNAARAFVEALEQTSPDTGQGT